MPAIASPCIRNCCLDDQDLCIGCLRTLEEILQWGAADDRRKRQILAEVAARKEARQNRREAPLAAKQEGFDSGKDDLGSHRCQDQAGDLAEDV